MNAFAASARRCGGCGKPWSAPVASCSNTVRGWLRAEDDDHSAATSAPSPPVSACCARIPRSLPTSSGISGRSNRSIRKRRGPGAGPTAKPDPIARRLMTVPGVGLSTTVRFVAALEEITDLAARPSSSPIWASYLARTPAPNGNDGPALRRPRRRRCAGVWCRPCGRRAGHVINNTFATATAGGSEQGHEPADRDRTFARAA